MDLIVTTCRSPFDAASHRKLWYKTTIRNTEQSYGPQIERAARRGKISLFPCCFVCEEAGGWRVEHWIPSEPFYPIWSKLGMAVGSALQAQSPLAMCECCRAGGAIPDPQSRRDGRTPPSEIILQQRCNFSTGQHPWPALTVWVCGCVSKLLVLPWSTASAAFC